MNNILEKKLIEYYKDILLCRNCNLKESYFPQYGLIGKNYNEGGIVFMQINPGHIGNMSDEEIKTRYKNEKNREQALIKKKNTDRFIKAQETFLKNPCIESFQFLTNETVECVKLWGWPNGKYIKVIEKHGADIDSVALLNIAQCPIPNDNFDNAFLKKCWSKCTEQLIGILKPRLIVAQGKIVKRLLDNFSCNAELIEGVHHAARFSNAEKEIIFRNVKERISPDS
jgi:hypothetical protein